MEQKKSIAIIGAGAIAKVLALKAKNMGITTYCFAWSEGAIAKNYVDKFYDISIFDKESILKICRKKNINGVLATTELTIAVADWLSNALHLNGNTLEVADHITNKWWVREHAAACKVMRQPLFFFLNSEKQNNTLLNKLEYPVIVKPTQEGGKRGVIVAENYEEIRQAIQYAFTYAKKEKGVLIEQFLKQGKEYSVEGISFHGQHQIIQITEKISSGPPHCVELGHHQPAALTEEMQDKVCLAVDELLSNVGFQNGATHTEVKIIDNSVYLIELNARLGGDFISYPLTELSSGYDYIKAVIQASVGEMPLPRDIHTNKAFAGVYFVTGQSAYLKSAFDSCDQEPWLYRKHVENMELQDLEHNDCYHTNYIIYKSDHRINL